MNRVSWRENWRLILSRGSFHFASLFTDSTKSAALSRPSQIIYDFNVLQSCPTNRRLSVEALGSLQTVLRYKTLIHMFWSWDDKSLISSFQMKKRLANDSKQAVLGCRSAAVRHQCFSSFYLHHLSHEVRSWLAVNNFLQFSLSLLAHCSPATLLTLNVPPGTCMVIFDYMNNKLPSTTNDDDNYVQAVSGGWRQGQVEL